MKRGYNLEKCMLQSVSEAFVMLYIAKKRFWNFFIELTLSEFLIVVVNLPID